MKLTSTFLALIALASTLSHAAISVSLTPAGSSRFIDHVSNAYAQVNLSPQGLYDLTTNLPYGPINPFVSTTWGNLGMLTLSGTPTLLGAENFTITGATGFDFDTVIDGAAATIVGAAYTTSLSAVTGNVALLNGAIIDLNFSANVAFDFVTLPPGFSYDGTLTITENTYNLSVDDANDFGFGNARQQWDVSGASSFAVIPEPSSALLGVLGIGCILRRRRDS